MITHDLSELSWTLTGFAPFQWQFGESMELGIALNSELPSIPANVPGSVQQALLAADILPDWNVGLNARQCEWVENRHWLFETKLPASCLPADTPVRLQCLGLDYAGWVYLNSQEVGRFTGTFVPHEFDLSTAYVPGQDNVLRVIFDVPPRWLGQYGYTSQMTDWKPRYNYTWDWTSRLVQIGIWDHISVQVGPPSPVDELRCWTSGNALYLMGPGESVHVTLSDGERIIREEVITGAVVWDDLPVERWWPNGQGEQKLYTVVSTAVDESVSRTWRVGFRDVSWRDCDDSPKGADPWICVVNDRPLFLQGVNWTPIRPNFADVSEEEYRQRLTAYRDLGCNVLRVWGGAFLEKDLFYNLCDELGLLVWQEFPLSSSGMENWPPEDPCSINALSKIARSYIQRRQHHCSLFMWSGGNELQGNLAGEKTGIGRPADNNHPLLGRLAEITSELDPTRRYVPTSASGPRFVADAADFGKGLHWDVHGPWRGEPDDYWSRDDALFRSELGAPGASPVALTEAYAGGLPLLPASIESPLWRRTSWWIQWSDFLAEHEREPKDIEEFVVWSQQQQADDLCRAVQRCKARFPSCGGAILWMGHDSFPCTANTAILDFHGVPKPAALALKSIWQSAAREEGDGDGQRP